MASSSGVTTTYARFHLPMRCVFTCMKPCFVMNMHAMGRCFRYTTWRLPEVDADVTEEESPAIGLVGVVGEAGAESEDDETIADAAEPTDADGINSSSASES